VSGHSGQNRGTDYNAGIADKAAYYREANGQMLVCALLEDVAVLDNLDTILSVPGIDLYSIGPNDFAQSLGYPGQPDHPEVVKTMQEITRRIRQDAIGRNARSVGQRYAARCGSSHSIIVARHKPRRLASPEEA
jgi:4-hydroxy-2-oxoheptanedioate aldolase